MILPIAEIRAAARDGRFLSAVEALYAGLDARIGARRPVCVNRGDCCRFGSFGHRLFVTPVELAYFLAQSDGPVSHVAAADACPYQRAGRCTARAARPMGCRVFFCESAAQGWQPGETEATLGRIKALHQRFDLPYVYVEWLTALRELGEPHADATLWRTTN